MLNVKNPLVCICVPTFNSEKTIRETLLSITRQTYSNLIVQVIDNASTDRTLSVIQAITDNRIIIYTNKVNIGAERNFNRCIKLSKGKYTAIYHADDIYESDMIEKQVSFLESHPQAGAVFTEARLIDDKNNFIGEIRTPDITQSADCLYEFNTIFKAVLQYGNFFICPSALVHTNIYRKEIKTWRGELFDYGADLDVWLRISKRHAIGIIRKPLMRYRVGQSQWSARVRMQTSRSIIFSIFDHYLQDLSTRKMLSHQDWKNYDWLDFRDSISRAVNAFLIGEHEKSRNLCRDIYSWGILTSSIKSRSRILVLIFSAYLKFLIFFRLYKLGKVSFIYIKRKTNS